MKCLKKCVIFCMLLMLLIPSGVFAADSYEFDEYGFKIDAGTNMIKARPASIAWEELASKKNVPLNKVWTVEFSDKVTMDKIAGIAIERNGEFIPVKISLMQGNKVSVTPADKFTGSTEYTLKVFLENGKNYKMDFTTVSEMRNVDDEPNYNYTDASSIYINETVKGSFAEDDYNDFYKVTLPQDGRLDITAVQLDGGKLRVYLYGQNGDDGSSIDYTYDSTTANLSKGLQAGTYYIKVYYSNYYGEYELTNSFTPQTIQNDSAQSSYIKAPQLELNKTKQGHIGYLSDTNVYNANDFYKIALPQDGTLDITATQLDGGKLRVYLYGQNGDDGSAIDYTYDTTTGRISKVLQAGTYYIKVYYSSYYGGYSLTNSFK